jgi:hypothetical protein
MEMGEGPFLGMSGPGVPFVRPCPTCECFVPEAARRCPRCEAVLEPIERREDAGTERDENGSREPVLVGAGGLAAPLTGSGHAATRNGAARIARPPLAPAAGVTPPPAAAKSLPAPCRADPLMLAVVLGLSDTSVEPNAHAAPVVEAPAVDDTPDAAAETNAPAEPPATVEAEPAAMPSTDRFAAMLGTALPVATTDELLPAEKAAAPPTSAPALVAVPLAVATPGESAALAPRRRGRRSRSDPFARTTTRRERILTRICMALAITLALGVVVLRLPLGARPDLGASGIPTKGAPSTSVTTESEFDQAIREQTQADLQVVIATALRLFPVWKSFVPESPLTLNRAAPQFGFVDRAEPSRRVGEMSVSGSARSIVLAEFAGPGHCAFARVIYRHAPEIITPLRATCSALAAPKHGWVALTN